MHLNALREPNPRRTLLPRRRDATPTSYACLSGRATPTWRFNRAVVSSGAAALDDGTAATADDDAAGDNGAAPMTAAGEPCERNAESIRK
jgi:hypothetical protein